MAQSFIGRKRLRKYYGKIREVLDMPNLIEVQKSSYDLFLNSGDQDTLYLFDAENSIIIFIGLNAYHLIFNKILSFSSSQ